MYYVSTAADISFPFVCGRMHRYTKQLSIRRRFFGKKEFKYVCQNRWYPIIKHLIRRWPKNEYDPWTYHPIYAPTKERLMDLLIQRLEHLDDTPLEKQLKLLAQEIEHLDDDPFWADI